MACPFAARATADILRRRSCRLTKCAASGGGLGRLKEVRLGAYVDIELGGKGGVEAETARHDVV